jgi:hypothetical protein
MRLQLWGGTAEEHTHDIDAYFATPQGGITFVVERPAGGLCGFIEVSLRVIVGTQAAIAWVLAPCG